MLTAFVPSLAFFAVFAIAVELQDPYGDDDNDLPLDELHFCTCRDIRVLLEPWNYDFSSAGTQQGPIARLPPDGYWLLQ